MKNISKVGKKEFFAALKRSQKKTNKYNATRVTIDGRTYASKREAEVSCDLRLRQRVGSLSTIEYQPRYELIPKPNLITYVADFLITYPDGRVEVIDVKGMETDVFKIKAKMFRHFYPHLRLVIMK